MINAAAVIEAKIADGAVTLNKIGADAVDGLNRSDQVNFVLKN